MLPFVREAEPIVRKQIRPFTRIGQPYVKNLGEAARDLATALPDAEHQSSASSTAS